MSLYRIILHALLGLALAIVIFSLNLSFTSKPLYELYADLFQHGQVYQGETRALLYSHFIFTVIAPVSLFLGGFLTWTLIKLGWLVSALVALVLVIVLSAVIFFRLEPVVVSPASLHEHPSTHWSGGADDGSFFEITQAAPSQYAVESRYESWTTGSTPSPRKRHQGPAVAEPGEVR